jgi:hypothetical protein
MDTHPDDAPLTVVQRGVEKNGIGMGARKNGE